jgi:hypothetical protein
VQRTGVFEGDREAVVGEHLAEAERVVVDDVADPVAGHEVDAALDDRSFAAGEVDPAVPHRAQLFRSGDSSGGDVFDRRGPVRKGGRVLEDRPHHVARSFHLVRALHLVLAVHGDPFVGSSKTQDR